MVKRCIMIFPAFKNMEIIQAIRDQYDPLARLVSPHITLVFPFESHITTGQLEAHIKEAVKDLVPFTLEMKGITGKTEPWGHYVFLQVTQGLDPIRMISKRLYSGILAPFQPPFYNGGYCPHMTVGRLHNKQDYEKALAEAGGISSVFSAVVGCISVEVIGQDESSSIELTVPLCGVPDVI